MRIDDVLLEKLNALPESRVKDAMIYSSMAGGKRIRPNFLYEVLKGYGMEESAGDAFAAAIEMIQTYSLIHDDLPAMDNDDLRRGKPTCHKQFDEATAILAGDGLLTYAFETAAASPCQPERVTKAIGILAAMSGPSGMVLGQNYDMESEDGITDFAQIKEIEKYKTGCLLSAPLMIGAVLAGKEDSVIQKWHEVGEAIGLAFQVQDDVLEVELSPEQFGKSNSDERNHKATAVSLLGRDTAVDTMHSLYQKGIETIEAMDGFQSKDLVEMIHQIEQRRK
jgi:geranylgeranyl pyrophosphate synthase